MQTVRDVVAALALTAGRLPANGSQFDADLYTFVKRGLRKAFSLVNPWPFQRYTAATVLRGSRSQALSLGTLTPGSTSIAFAPGEFTTDDDGAFLWDSSFNRTRIGWVDTAGATVHLLTAWPAGAAAASTLTVIPGWESVVSGGAIVGVRTSDGYGLAPEASASGLLGPVYGQPAPVPQSKPISYLDSVNDVPPAPRTVQGVATVAAVAQGVRTIEIGMAYRFGASGPIGPVSQATSYTLSALQTLEFTAPALTSGAVPYYRVYYWRCPDLGWTDWRLVYDNAHSQCPPNGGVTLQPTLSLTRLESDSIGLQDRRWQPNHLLMVYPPPDTSYTMVLTVEERFWEEHWELSQKIPGSAEAGEVALNFAISEMYAAFGMLQESTMYSNKAEKIINTALGQARPRAGDQPMRMGGISLWR